MGLEDEYREKVETVSESMDSRLSEQDALSIKSSLDDVLPFVILLLGFVVLFNFVLNVSSRIQVWITWANYIVISYFAVRLLVDFRLSSSRNKFFHEHVFDILMVVPAISILQEVRMFKLLQEGKMISFMPEFATGSAVFQSTGIAAKLTRILRIIKRSIGF